MTTLNNVLFNGEAAHALTATRYTNWVRCNQLNEVGFAIHTLGTGSPVGVFSFEGSNDGDQIDREYVAGVAPSASAAKKFAITGGTVQGDSLSITGSSPSNSYVPFVGGIPRFLRVKFTYASGGSASSVPYIFTSGRGSF